MSRRSRALKPFLAGLLLLAWSGLVAAQFIESWKMVKNKGEGDAPWKK